MADDDIKRITDQVAADNTAMQGIETGANCEQKADELSDATEAQSKLTEANEAKQEADGKLQEAEQAEIRPPLVFSSLDPEQGACPDVYSSDEYKEAKTNYDTAKAAADNAQKLQQLAQQSADDAAKAYEKATHECLCDAQKVHAQLVGEHATTNADNQQVWEDSHAILAILDGDENIAELAQTTTPECPTVTIPDLTDEAKSAECEGEATNTEAGASNTEAGASNTEAGATNAEAGATNAEAGPEEPNLQANQWGKHACNEGTVMATEEQCQKFADDHGMTHLVYDPNSIVGCSAYGHGQDAILDLVWASETIQEPHGGHFKNPMHTPVCWEKPAVYTEPDVIGYTEPDSPRGE
jgi:hypothetical protein